jgi:hypothetical protein
MRTVIVIVWTALVFVSLATAVAAFIDLHTILVTCPTLTLLGLLFAVVTLSRQSWPCLIFGLSAPFVCALCAFLIAFFRLGPDWGTGWPIVAVFVAYNIVMLPPAVFILTRVGRKPRADESRSTWRFGMKAILSLMTAVSVIAVVLRFAAKSKNDLVFFGTFAGICAMLAAFVVWRFSLIRKGLTDIDASKQTIDFHS